MRRVGRALLAVSVSSDGFASSQLAEHVRGQNGGADPPYGPRQAAYDLQKFREKKLVCRLEGARRYRVLPDGVRTISALLILRNHVLAPLLTSTHEEGCPAETAASTSLGRLYHQLRGIMRQVFDHLGIAA
jgi:hypothetical protein